MFDQQASMEGSLSMLVSSLSGANLVHDVGHVEYGSTSCFEQVVVMDELAGEIRFILEGIQVTKESLALEVIDQVRPGGEYVTSDPTYRHFREGWFPALVGDRHAHEDWIQKGGKTLGDRANEKVREILASHTPEPLSDAVEARVKALIAEAEHPVAVMAASDP